MSPPPSLPPGYVRSLDDYWLWLEQLIAASGGFLDGGALDVEPVVGPDGTWLALRIRQQRLNFWNDTFLALSFAVNTEFEQEKYSFHFYRVGGVAIWRKDNVHQHEGIDGRPHIHRNPRQPHTAEPFADADLAEALQEVAEYAAGGGS